MARHIRRLIPIALTCLGTVAWPALAAAQDVQVRGPANAEIYVVTDRGRVLLGTLGTDGEARIPERLVDKDKELQVVLNEGTTGTGIALVERDRHDDTCLDTSPAGSRCQYTGTFVRWGRVSRLSISPAGQVAVEGGRLDGRDRLDWGPGWMASGTVGQGFMNNSDRLCAQGLASISAVAVTASCSSDTRPRTWSADIGATFFRFGVVKAGWIDVNSVGYTLTASNGLTTGEAVGSFGRARGPVFLAGVRFDVGPVVPYVEAGVWRWTASSRLNATATTTPAFFFAQTQSDSAWDPVFGAGLDVWVVRYVGVTAGVRWVKLQTDGSSVRQPVDQSFTIASVGLKIGKR